MSWTVNLLLCDTIVKLNKSAAGRETETFWIQSLIKVYFFQDIFGDLGNGMKDLCLQSGTGNTTSLEFILRPNAIETVYRTLTSKERMAFILQKKESISKLAGFHCTKYRYTSTFQTLKFPTDGTSLSGTVS